MKNNFFVGLAIIAFFLYQWLTYAPPKDPIRITKFLSQAEPALDAKDLIGCSIKSNGIYFETCVLRVEPDVHKINAVLIERGWFLTANNRFGNEQTGAWCKGKGTLYAGYDKDRWEILYAENERDRCVAK